MGKALREPISVNRDGETVLLYYAESTAEVARREAAGETVPAPRCAKSEQLLLLCQSHRDEEDAPMTKAEIKEAAKEMKAEMARLKAEAAAAEKAAADAKAAE